MSESNCTFVHNVPSSNKFQSQTSITGTKSHVLSSCRICLSKILDPAVLTCGHRFCEKCLFQYWDDIDKPESIICPLCRGNAYKVDFTKKDDISATEDFRKTFNGLPKQNRKGQEINSVLNIFLKLSLLIPIFYCILNWIHIPVNFLSCVWQFPVTMENKM